MFQIYADSMRIATRTEPLELTPYQARAGKPSFKAEQRPPRRWLRWITARKSTS